MSQSTPRLYFENSAGRLLEHPDGYATFHYRPGPRKLHHLQALFTHLGQLLQRHGWTRFLADQREMAAFSEEELRFIAGFWRDRNQLLSTQTQAAIIMATDVFARLSMSQLTHNVPPTIVNYKLFESAQEAESWLRGQG